MKREQCYQFRKHKTLKTSVQFFPEAIKHLSSDMNKTIFEQYITSHSSTPEVQTSHDKFAGRIRKKVNPLVLPFDQEKLVNIARYRNILRKQLGLTSLNEPFILENNNQTGKLNSIGSLKPLADSRSARAKGKPIKRTKRTIHSSNRKDNLYDKNLNHYIADKSMMMIMMAHQDTKKIGNLLPRFRYFESNLN